jgi:hypothetical protein
MSWDNLGLISVVLSWAGLVFMIWYWKGDFSKTFSQNAARQKSTIIYYAILWLICLPPFTWFLLFPFYETLQLNGFFRIIGIIAALGMLIAALIPETVGWKAKVHRFSAFMMAWCFIPLTLLIAFSPVVSVLGKTTSFLTSFFMLFSAIYLLKKNAEHPNLLSLQGLYIAVFQVSVLVAYYL